MRKLSRILAVLLAAVMVLGAFAACTPKPNDTTPEPKTTDEAKNTPDPAETPSGDETNPPETEKPADATPVPDKPLVVAYGAFSQKFSPFYSETVYDSDVAGLCGLDMMVTDRMGAIIFNAIEGETIAYNGTDYLYTGPANLSVKKNGDQTVYTTEIRKDLKFSDGEPVTAKDILFTYYTYLDPSYVGSNSLSSYDIVGLRNWRTQTSDAVYEKYAEMADTMLEEGRGEGYVQNDLYSEEIYNDFWGWIDEMWTETCSCIVDYCVNNYGENEAYTTKYLGKTPDEIAASDGLKVALGMAMWNFAELNEDGSITDVLGLKTYDLVNEFPTVEDYVELTTAAYEDDPVEFYNEEQTGNERAPIFTFAKDNLIGIYGPKDADMSADGITEISGIKMLDDYTVEITVNGYEAPAVYSILGITITPMHYYGDTAKWNPEKGQYGFDFNDLSTQQAKTERPMGAGPYMFESFENKVVTFKANPNYYKGEPIIKTIKFKETTSAEVATAIKTGDADAGEMTGSIDRFNEVKGINGNDNITGPIITTSKVDNLGYGYIGISAGNVNVGGVPDSDASKALRKGLATVLAVYREVAFDSYYGEAASVIQYPISNTSWAAPQASDPGYKIAFSTDADGNDIYTASMTADEKYAAAMEAALTWFKAAGYTVEDGKITAAPAGARTEFEVIIGGDGKGDHPSYQILTMARDAFDKVGITISINDPSDTSYLWKRLNADDQDLWCAAWGSSIDPDMYQIYHSNNVTGAGGTDSNRYHIADAELDELIMEARTSDDQSFRKSVYKQCLDIIVDWAVEIPAYQRQNCVVFSTERINISTLTPDITTFWSWMRDIEKLEMN